MGQFIEVTKAYKQAGKHHPVSVKAGGKHYTALIKHVTLDPKKNTLTHVVFNAVKANEKVTAEIPVRITFDEGNDASPAERAGLVVLHQLEVVEVEALPRDLPEAILFNGEKLVAAGDSATVADLIVPGSVTIKADPAHPIATVFEPSALQAANDAAGGTDEPEPEEETTDGAAVEETQETAPEKSNATADKKE